MPTATSSRVVLRSAFGSHAEVVRVFSYHADRGTACVLFHGEHGNEHECVSESDLEAFDSHLRYTSVAAELKRRAEHKI